MARIALITYRDDPELNPSDRMLVAPLQERGIAAVPVPWDADGVDWHAYDGLLLRSCWDYHRYPDRFAAWIRQVAAEGIPLWNSAPLVLWNMDKVYLRDLAQACVPTIPTVWLERGAKADLAAILADRGWAKAVVKPRIGASAYQAWAVAAAAAAAAQARFRAQVGRSGIMVQQFAEGITAGEWSLVFFRGTFSHAVLNRPAPDNFFVQTEHGGESAIGAPPAAFIEAAAQIIACGTRLADPAASPPVYARVDGLDMDGHLVLMELELIEPFLSLHLAGPKAAQQFAYSIAAAIPSELHTGYES